MLLSHVLEPDVYMKLGADDRAKLAAVLKKELYAAPEIRKHLQTVAGTYLRVIPRLKSKP
jgi:hypothetical protein